MTLILPDIHHPGIHTVVYWFTRARLIAVVTSRSLSMGRDRCGGWVGGGIGANGGLWGGHLGMGSGSERMLQNHITQRDQASGPFQGIRVRRAAQLGAPKTPASRLRSPPVAPTHHVACIGVRAGIRFAEGLPFGDYGLRYCNDS